MTPSKEVELDEAKTMLFLKRFNDLVESSAQELVHMTTINFHARKIEKTNKVEFASQLQTITRLYAEELKKKIDRAVTDTIKELRNGH